MFQETIKVQKWWEWVPFFGTIAYIIRVDLTRQKIENKKEVHVLGMYRTIFNLISIAIAVTFLVCFLVFRNTSGFGNWPWFFWLGLGFGIVPNLTPVLPMILFKLGIKRWQKQVVGDEKSDLELKK